MINSFSVSLISLIHLLEISVEFLHLLGYSNPSRPYELKNSAGLELPEQFADLVSVTCLFNDDILGSHRKDPCKMTAHYPVDGTP